MYIDIWILLGGIIVIAQSLMHLRRELERLQHRVRITFDQCENNLMQMIGFLFYALGCKMRNYESLF